MTMRISREAKILLGVLFLAAAAYLWINLFTQSNPALVNPVSPAPAVVTPQAPSGELAAPQAGTAVTGATLTEGENVAAAQPQTNVAAAPSAIATAREVEVAVLPFLITEPPIADPLAETGTEDGITRPQGDLRATINPFSPILLQASAPAAEPPAVVNVPIPAPPGLATTGNINVPTIATPDSIAAPVPNPKLPATSRASALPRPLPGGTLPVTPAILRSARTNGLSASASRPNNLASVAAIRVPGQTLPNLEEVTANAATTAESEVDPVQATGSTAGRNSDPVQAGTSELSRYLRDNNFRFTGSVIGPVGVGIFRSNIVDAPVVVSLGQTLPSTDIVLTSLKGKQAEFTQDGKKYALTLDLR